MLLIATASAVLAAEYVYACVCFHFATTSSLNAKKNYFGLLLQSIIVDVAFCISLSVQQKGQEEE